MNKPLCSRKGISIVEVVIALVIITVISASALSMILMSVNVEKKTVATLEVANHAENAVECFRYADNHDVFLECLQKTADFIKEDDSFILRAGSYTVTILPKDHEFEYTAVNTDGVEIYAFTYTKSLEGGGLE